MEGRGGSFFTLKCPHEGQRQRLLWLGMSRGRWSKGTSAILVWSAAVGEAGEEGRGGREGSESGGSSNKGI